MSRKNAPRKDIPGIDAEQILLAFTGPVGLWEPKPSDR
jgi:hypothetical protein